MFYFRLLELFVLKILFQKDEYNITSKNFNPIRFFLIISLVLNVFFTIYLLSKISIMYEKVYEMCPKALDAAVVASKENKKKHN